MAPDAFELSVLFWVGALLAGALSRGQAPVQRRAYPVVAATIFAFFAIVGADGALNEPAVLPRLLWPLGLLVFACFGLYWTRRSPLSLVVLFILLFTIDLFERFGLSVGGIEVLRPLGFSYFLFRLYDALNDFKEEGPVEWRRTAVSCLAPPTLVAGPIVLSGHHRSASRPLGIDSVAYRRALLLFALGVIKIKLLLPFVEARFETGVVLPAALSPALAFNVWRTGIYHYVQLFLDFSGYSDIAVSACALLGLRIRHNFLQPYLAVSLSDFWRRWHVTLGDFFRRHVYRPRGGRRRIGNIPLVFALLGLWHGFTAAFLLWGLLHAGYLLFERYALRPALLAIVQRWSVCRLPTKWVQYALTQSFVACSWVLFFKAIESP